MLWYKLTRKIIANLLVEPQISVKIRPRNNIHYQEDVWI